MSVSSSAQASDTLTSMKSRMVRSSVAAFANSCLFSRRALLRATMTSSKVDLMASVVTAEQELMRAAETPLVGTWAYRLLPAVSDRYDGLAIKLVVSVSRE